MTDKAKKVHDIISMTDKHQSMVLKALLADPYEVPETIMRQAGIPQEAYEKAINAPGFMDDLFEESMKYLAAPLIPGILKSMFEGASEGNEAKAKIALQLLDKLKPDSVNNFNFGSYSNDDLVNRLETLKEQLSNDE